MSAFLVLDFQTSPWLFTAIALAILFAAYRLFYNRLYPAIYGAPGPKPELLIGNIRNLLLNHKNTWQIWKAIEPFGPIVSVWFGTKRTVFVSGPDITAEIVKNKEDFEADPQIVSIFASIVPHMIIAINGNDWKRHRKALSPLMSNQRIKNSLKNLDKTISISIEGIRQKAINLDGPIDIKADIQAAAMDIVGYLVFGHAFRDIDDHPNLAAVDLGAFWSSLEALMAEFVFRTLTLGLYKIFGDSKKVRNAKNEVSKIVNLLLDEYDEKIKQKNEGSLSHYEWNSYMEQSFIAQVFDSPEGKDFTHDEMRGEMIAIILAGSDTSYSTMGFAVKLLSNHPEIQEKLYEEILSVIGKDAVPTYEALQAGAMPYLDKVVKEIQRLSLVAPNILRSSNKDVIVNGVAFPKGTSFWLAQAMMHRDARYWKDPLAFIPERWDDDGIANGGPINPNAYMPFGAGPRVCFGQKFAVIEEKFFLIYLVRNFFFKELPSHLADKVGEEDIVQHATISIKNFVALPVLRP